MFDLTTSSEDVLNEQFAVMEVEDSAPRQLQGMLQAARSNGGLIRQLQTPQFSSSRGMLKGGWRAELSGMLVPDHNHLRPHNRPPPTSPPP